MRDDFIQTTISKNDTILDWLRDADFDSKAQLMGIIPITSQAMWEYQPRVYPTRIIFFRASEKDVINAKNPERAWFGVAQRRSH